MWSAGGSGQNTEGGQIVKIEVLLATGNLVFLKTLYLFISIYVFLFSKTC